MISMCMLLDFLVRNIVLFKMKIWFIGFIFCLLFIVVDCFLIEWEIVFFRVLFGRMFMLIRYVEFVGIVDNGMLDCFVFGFIEFRW